MSTATTTIPEKYRGLIFNFNPDTSATAEYVMENMKAGGLLKTLAAGGKISQKDKEYLTISVNNSIRSYLSAGVNILGYTLNFNPYMKTYLANTDGRQWTEYRAFNVKALRKYLSRCGVPYAAALRITELKQKD